MSPPDSSRTRIRDAACEEFAAVGYAGARVDAIARRAGCNKQLIYHYYGDKNGLFEAVATEILSDRPPMNVTSPQDLGSNLEAAYDHIASKRAWTRMMMWEALSDDPTQPVVAEAARRAHFTVVSEEMRQLQDVGIFDRAICPRLILFTAMALLVAPFQMPHLLRLVTGNRAEDPDFRRPYLALVTRMLAALGPPRP
jgi:AcrR family transcriptional regulator